MRDVLSKTFHALADPTRREILQMLSKQDMAAGEIAAHFDMSAPSISHHLSTLKQAELVRGTRNGQSIIYSFNATVMQEVMQILITTLDIDHSAKQTTANFSSKT
ncbi:MAG: autorepressor SdpR family transcription factor [Chloroflexi bacterium]|nr:autorepressor SdpR family transcription factor [Chloroflexota bacterium]